MTPDILSSLNKNLVRLRFTLLWHKMKFVLMSIYLIAWLHLPLIAGAFLAKSKIPSLALPVMSMLIINLHTVSDDGWCANKKYKEIKDAETSLGLDIEEAEQFKHLLKKGLKETMKYTDYYELKGFLRNIGVDIQDLKEIKTDNS